MSRFPGRRIEPSDSGFNWYMNPEGRPYSRTSQTFPNAEGITAVVGEYDGTHAVYVGLPTRFSLADIVLFHPDVSDRLLAPYESAIHKLVNQLPDSSALSAESAHMLDQLERNGDTLANECHPNLKAIEQTLAAQELSFSIESVAHGLGRILVHQAMCFTLTPFGRLASSLATLSRLSEELLMIAVLFQDKRPVASSSAYRLAVRLIRYGHARYGNDFWIGLKVSLLAHFMRRAEAPHAPPSLPSMMESVAANLHELEEGRYGL